MQDAVDKLITRQYAIPDQEYMSACLTTILFQVMTIRPAEAAGIVKAVTVLLNEL